MKFLRNEKLLRVSTFCTIVIFLNMGFFLAEVCMLDLRDHQLIGNVANLVLNGGLEEERDGHSGTADAPAKVFPMMTDALLLRHSSLFLLAAKIYHDSTDSRLQDGHTKIFSPPPEVLHLS